MPRPRELHDKYFLQAKAEGYAARSAYKLKQIHERYGVLRPGDAVLDLGCAPGSWLQVASEIAGPHGVLVGIDLLPVSIQLPGNVTTMIADAFAVDPRRLLDMTRRPGLFSVVLSDMAPNTAGIGDDLRSVSLCRRVLEIAATALAPGGRLVMKVLEGELYPDLMRETLGLFEFARGYRPDATRQVSREIFVVAMRFKGHNPSTAPPPVRAGPGWSDVPTRALPPHKRPQVEMPYDDPSRSRRFKPPAKGTNAEPGGAQKKRKRLNKPSGPGGPSRGKGPKGPRKQGPRA